MLEGDPAAHEAAQAGAVDAAWAFRRYEEIRDRLPAAEFAGKARRVADLGAVEDRFDAFVFDSFGVLNVGGTPIAGARERIAALRAAGKRVLVLTNAATTPLRDLPAKYAAFGFDFEPREIVSSREILAGALAARTDIQRWGIVAPAEAAIAELPLAGAVLVDRKIRLGDVEGLVLLSSQIGDAGVLDDVAEALVARPRPLYVGNPDLVAPRETGFSREPGSWAHAIADQTGITPDFFGKPYGNAFDAALHRLGDGVDPARVAMVGDTLHTDILGGAAAGFGTVLVTDFGVLKDLDVAACINTSGIVPDYVIPHI